MEANNVAPLVGVLARHGTGCRAHGVTHRGAVQHAAVIPDHDIAETEHGAEQGVFVDDLILERTWPGSL